MRLKLPGLNASALSRSFVLRQARRRVTEVLDRLGEERLRFLIENNQGLSHYLSKEQEAQFRRQAQSYGFIAKAITVEDFPEVLPEWVKGLVIEYGESGQQWVEAQMRWLISFFKEEEDAPTRSAVQWRRRDQSGAADDKAVQPEVPRNNGG